MDSALTPHVRGRKQVNLDNRPSDRFGPSPQCPEYTDVVGDMLDGTLRDDQVGVLEGLWRDILCRRLAEGAAGPVRSPAIAGTRIDASVARKPARSEEHTSELQSLMRISNAVFCLKKKNKNKER